MKNLLLVITLLISLQRNKKIIKIIKKLTYIKAPTIEQPFLFMAVFLILFRVYFRITDKATSILIRFFNMVLVAFDRTYRFPTTPDTIKNHLNFDSLTNNLTYYAVCPQCHALFNRQSSIPPYCTAQQFPYHPLESKRSCCNTDFAVSIPREFVYNSLKASLERIVKRPGYMDLAESWRNRDVPSDMLFDIYDGNVWNDFTKLDKVSPNEHLVLLTLNIDWFEPFHNANYSCGAIYLTINNLPRSERFKKENVILVGVMPGPSASHTTELNNYLSPLVDELIMLYDQGIQVSNPVTGSPILIRAALMMVACDMPAARKTCGFTSPVSRRGCYKCDRTFVVDNDTNRVNFSGGYDVENYQWQNKNDVATHAAKWMTATTNKDRVEIERNYGTRWSELHRLSYFDAARFTIIDAMHNLLLGTPKRMFNDWVDDGDLTREDLRRMKHIAEGLVLPIDFDMISPDRIAGGLSGLKAAEWKSWVLIYSPFLLQNHLDDKKFQHWMKLVSACRILLKPSITFDEVNSAHSYLVEFCKEYETIYGSNKVTPNIHAHCHIKECILNYGGVYSTWLFGFERYNGILGSIATNRKGAFERTFTKRFLEQTSASDYINTFITPHINDDQNDFLLGLGNNLSTTAAVTRLNTIENFDISDYIRNSVSVRHATGSEPLPPNTIPNFTAPPTTKLTANIYNALVEFYKVAYGEENADHHLQQSFLNQNSVLPYVYVFKDVKFHGYRYRSVASQSIRGSYIQALYLEYGNDEPAAYPGQVQYYFCHDFRVNGVKKRHTFAFVRWLDRHIGQQKFSTGDIETWKSTYEELSWQCVLPLSRIYSPVAIAKYKASNVQRTIVIPLEQKVHA